jgi:predicted  nucleic acid-binding Zn-ribbon protein
MEAETVVRYLVGGAALVGGTALLLVASLENPAHVITGLGSTPPASVHASAPPSSQSGQSASASTDPQTVRESIDSLRKQEADEQAALVRLKAAHERRIKEAQQDVDLLHGKAAHLRGEIAALEQQQSSGKAALDKLSSDHGTLLAAAQKEIAGLHDQADAARHDLAALQQQVADEKTALERARSQREAATADVRKELDTLHGQVDAAREELANVQQQRTAEQAAIDRLKAAHAQLAFAAGSATNTDRRAAAPARPVSRNASPPDASAAGSAESVLDRLRQQPAAQPAAAPAQAVTPAFREPRHISSRERLMMARDALAGGRTADARQLLEEAQLQLVFRPVGPDDGAPPPGNPEARLVADALRSLGAGDPQRAITAVDQALAGGQAAPAGSPYSASPRVSLRGPSYGDGYAGR